VGPEVNGRHVSLHTYSIIQVRMTGAHHAVLYASVRMHRRVPDERDDAAGQDNSQQQVSETFHPKHTVILQHRSSNALFSLLFTVQCTLPNRYNSGFFTKGLGRGSNRS